MHFSKDEESIKYDQKVVAELSINTFQMKNELKYDEY